MTLATDTRDAWSLAKAQREQLGDGINETTRMMRAATLWSATESLHVRSLLEQAFSIEQNRRIRR